LQSAPVRRRHEAAPPPASAVSGRRRGAASRRRCRRGNVAIEFAILGPIFLMLMFGVLEVSLAYYAGTSLEAGVHEAARQVRTGRTMQAADPVADFKTNLCRLLTGVIACPSAVVIDVRNFNSFNSMTLPSFTNPDGSANGTVFQPGSAGSIVLVRVAYFYQFKTPLLG
jgi:Flp pilus assembly protein TadG